MRETNDDNVWTVNRLNSWSCKEKKLKIRDQNLNLFESLRQRHFVWFHDKRACFSIHREFSHNFDQKKEIDRRLNVFSRSVKLMHLPCPTDCARFSFFQLSCFFPPGKRNVCRRTTQLNPTNERRIIFLACLINTSSNGQSILLLSAAKKHLWTAGILLVPVYVTNTKYSPCEIRPDSFKTGYLIHSNEFCRFWPRRGACRHSPEKRRKKRYKIPYAEEFREFYSSYFWRRAVVLYKIRAGFS